MNSRNLHRFLLVALLAAVFSSGCTSMSATLRELLDAGNSQKAQEKGQKWLDKYAEKPKYRQEADIIIVLVCEAEFNLAVKADTVEAYQHFKSRYKGVSGTGDFWKQALIREASAYYRDITTREDSVLAYQKFQAQYPAALERPRAATREAELALEAVAKLPGTEAIRRFLNNYSNRVEAAESVKKGRDLLVSREFQAATQSGQSERVKAFRDEFASWPEAAAIMPQAREIECRMAFDRAMASGKVGDLGFFRTFYGDWPEAATLEPQAYDAEAGLALKNAFAVRDVTQLKTLKGFYTRGQWPDRYDDAVADLYVQAVKKNLDAHKIMSPDEIDAILKEVAPFVRLPERAEPIRVALMSFARSSRDGPTLFLAASFYPGDPESPKLMALAETEYWKVVEAQDRAESWLRFSSWFPQSRNAPVAEQRYLWHMEIANRHAFGLYGNITRTIRQPNGDIDVYVDVRNREGNVVNGLTRDAFRVFRGSLNAEVVDYWGMDEDRPLDIIFDIDMSGSMETERNAVRQAIAQFVNRLMFRGREANLGLVSFSDQVLDKYTFTSDTNKFMKWMSTLNATTGGGTGEDGVAALLDSVSMLRSSRGERIGIFLSDEPFQMNLGGRQMLGIKTVDNCTRVRGWITCKEKCMANERKGVTGYGPGNGGDAVMQSGPTCEAFCAQALGGEATKFLTKCTARRNLAMCVRDRAIDNIANNMYRGCGDPVLFGSSTETASLIKQMDRVQLRPFFLVTRKNIGGNSAYNTISDSLQGRVIEVPEDSSSSEPYEAALMQIADQLSSQYVIRYRPTKAMKPESPLVVVVRPIHRWSTVSTTPQVEVKEIATLSDNPACPEFMLFSAEGIHVSSECSRKWDLLDAEFFAPVADVRVSGSKALVVTEEQRMWVWDLNTRTMNERAFGMKQILGYAWEGTEGFWVTGYLADRSIAVEYRSIAEGGPSRSFLIPAAAGIGAGRQAAYPVVLRLDGQRPEDVCVLVGNDRMMCSTSAPAVWKDVKVAGLPAAALAGVSSLMYVSAHDKVMLLAGADGALYRSISNGTQWTRVLEPVTGGRKLSTFGTNPKLVCATSGKDVFCSEDAGARFFPMGLGLLGGKGAALASVGGMPMLASEGEIQRLYRVQNRELPSSAVYFETNKATPSDQMLPFLIGIARDMRNSPDSWLRVEGHADARGSAEHNEELAKRRAEAVAEVLKANGVPAARIIVLSYGEKRPIQAGTGPRALSRNRRVELIMLKAAPKSWYDSQGH